MKRYVSVSSPTSFVEAFTDKVKSVPSLHKPDKVSSVHHVDGSFLDGFLV